MKFVTKFDVGQTVYYALLYHEYINVKCTLCDGNGKLELKSGELIKCPQCDGSKFKGVRRKHYSVRRMKVQAVYVWQETGGTVNVQYKGDGSYLFEPDVYATRAEAQAECDKKNKEHQWKETER